MLFASSFSKQPNTGSPAEAMGGFCLLTGFAAAVIGADHRASAWDSPRQGDVVYSSVINASAISAAGERNARDLRERLETRDRSELRISAIAPELALNTRILDVSVDAVEDSGGFAGYELAGFHNCTGRSRSKERPRKT